MRMEKVAKPAWLSAAFIFFLTSALFFPEAVLAQSGGGDDKWWRDSVDQANRQAEKDAERDYSELLTEENKEPGNGSIVNYEQAYRGTGEGEREDPDAAATEPPEMVASISSSFNFANSSPDPSQRQAANQQSGTYRIQLKDAVMSCKIETQSAQAETPKNLSPESMGLIKAAYRIPILENAAGNANLIQHVAAGPGPTKPGACPDGAEKLWIEKMTRTRGVIDPTWKAQKEMLCKYFRDLEQKRQQQALNDPKKAVGHDKRAPKKVKSEPEKNPPKDQGQPCDSEKGCFYSPSQ